MLALIRPALVTTLFFTLLLGVAYPLAVTAVGGLAFPAQASGSLVMAGGHVAGSSLIGQAFARPDYFHPRPSAAGTSGYDASASSGSNLGPLNADLAKRVADSASALRAENPGQVVPADAVTTSGSGLDPDISPAFAAFQVPRVAKARGVAPAQVSALVAAATQARWLGVFGQPRVNVLSLNLALDARYPLGHPAKP
jgi:K+-transporting ATPase ATPase C chain